MPSSYVNAPGTGMARWTAAVVAFAHIGERRGAREPLSRPADGAPTRAVWPGFAT